MTVARGGGGPGLVAQLLAARRSWHLILLRALLDGARDVGHPDAAAVRDAYQTLADLQGAVPGAVRAVLDDPLVGSWAMRVVRHLHSARPLLARPADLGLVTVAAAVRGRVETTLDLSRTTQVDGLALPTLGTAHTDSAVWGMTEIRTRSTGCDLISGHLRVQVPDEAGCRTPRWSGVPWVSVTAKGLRWSFRLDHSRVPEAGGARLDDLGRSAVFDQWHHALTAGWSNLVMRHQQVASEVSGAVSVIVPLAGAAPVSATPADALGAVAVSGPPGGTALAATLAHEIQHLKLAGLNRLVPMVQAGSRAVGYAPWRDDPRPVAGLLHGAYAHLGVAGYWRRERRHAHGNAALNAHTEFARWRQAAGDVARRLAVCQHLTPAGRLFSAEMTLTLDRWIDEPVPAKAASAADELLRRHRALWDAAQWEPPVVRGRDGSKAERDGLGA